jgi:hypothetical protein
VCTAPAAAGEKKSFILAVGLAILECEAMRSVHLHSRGLARSTTLRRGELERLNVASFDRDEGMTINHRSVARGLLLT